MTPPTHYLIVGQGIAGTLMAWRLQQSGHSFHVIDPGHVEASSTVAAGIINPVTGRRIVKSWRFDELLPELQRTYGQMEAFLETPFLHPSRVLRVLPNVQEENKWAVQTARAGYEDYIAPEADPSCFLPYLHPFHAFGEIRYAYTVDWPLLLARYRAFLTENGQLTEARFAYDQLEFGPEYLTYGERRFRNIIFCEGHGVRHNPWFGHLPFEFAKGEVLLIYLPGANFDAILKHRLLIAPWQGDVYWAGSNYERGATDSTPTSETRAYLIERLRQTFRVPIDVVDHLAAVRPTVVDRRPLLGRHPEHPRLILFNGLGTKGSSLAPYWSKHLLAHLEEGKALDAEVDLRRFGE